MRVLPYLTVFIKLFTSTDISKIILYRGYFFLLCDCCPLGPYFQNGADHWREIGMSLNCRVSEGFSVPATQAKVISEATWFPKWRWLATADLKIYPIQFFTSGMGLLPCKNPNVYLGPVSFFFFFFTLLHNHRQYFSSLPQNWILVGTLSPLSLLSCDSVPHGLCLSPLTTELGLSSPAACSAWLKKPSWKLLKGSRRGWPEEAYS